MNSRRTFRCRSDPGVPLEIPHVPGVRPDDREGRKAAGFPISSTEDLDISLKARIPAEDGLLPDDAVGADPDALPQPEPRSRRGSWDG